MSSEDPHISWEATDPSQEALPVVGDRYVALGLLGRGGMGSVYAVHDAVFDRVVAMKVANHGASAVALRRFEDEARITAQLDHPGVVPVHDYGRTSDGRAFLVMQRIEGVTLRQLLEERATPVRTLVAHVRSIAETLAYAHAQGVHHRDLKPENVMIGRYGEVRVMDWGLARAGAVPDPQTGDAPPVDARLTAAGTVTGTPAYMAPEQAHGELVGPPTDVFALGLLLLEVLSGRQVRKGRDLLGLLLAATRPVQVPDSVPDGLARLARAALEMEPADRIAASSFAAGVGAWLEGAERADLARERLAEARASFDLEVALRVREDVLQDELAELRDEPARLREAWAVEDRLRTLELERARREADVDRLLGLARSHAPELPELQELLADVAVDRAERAELDGRPLDAARHEDLVRRHDRGRHAAWLDGTGALTLVTDPPGIEVRATRIERRDRRRVPEGEVLDLGTTPLDRVSLPRGSWLLDVAGHAVPVEIRRGEHWDGVPPGGSRPEPLCLPRLGPGERWVPPGPFRAYGDPKVRFPRREYRVWVDGFAMRVFPVTQGEYLAFVNDQVGRRPRAEVEALVPATRDIGRSGPPQYLPDGDRYTLPGKLHPEMPVLFVDWHCACAFADWEAARTGLPWRLATRAEREKAARGVDGRPFPWGDAWHPEYANLGLSAKEASPQPVDTFPADVSPYGIRGLGGNSSDWLLDSFEQGNVLRARAVVSRADGRPYHQFAGGAWNTGEVYARSANVGRYKADIAMSSLGFRLVRST